MLKWKAHQFGGGITMEVGKVGDITISRSMSSLDRETPYIVNVFGRKMKQKFSEREEAQLYGLKVAEAWLTESAYELAAYTSED